MEVVGPFIIVGSLLSFVGIAGAYAHKWANGGEVFQNLLHQLLTFIRNAEIEWISLILC